MKTTKKLQDEITTLMNDYWNSYFRGDIEHWGNYLVDDYRNIGGTKEEIWNSKKEILDYTFGIIDQMVGMANIRNKKTQVISYDPYLMVHEFMDLFIKVEDEWTFYGNFRLSSLIQNTPGGWKVLHQHGSYPDSHTEQGEAFAFNKLKEENTQLREAVKRRTIELENKNRELEIESSLERVRTVAMSMHKPDEILEICKIIYNELQSLGFTDLRNTIINFWIDESDSIIDYDYSDFTGANKSTLKLSNHLVFEQFNKKIKRSKDAFAKIVVKKEQLESWKQLRREGGEYEDPRLNDIPALYYYFYSIGVGAIGISTFNALPNEKLDLLKRFRNVFDLAYRRYKDVENAEAQAKEAQIQLALERVRSRSMAMHKSDELLEVVKILADQLTQLEFKFDNVSFGENNQADDFKFWVATTGDAQPIQLQIPYLDNPAPKRVKEAQKNGVKYFADILTQEENRQWSQHLIDHSAPLNSLPENIKNYILNSAGYARSTVILKDINIYIGNYRAIPYSDYENRLFQRFAQVFEQSYTRFLDLQKAEAQAREANIETALERVRSRSLAMHKSDELNEVVLMLFEQFIGLGINIDGININILNENRTGFDSWFAAPGYTKAFCMFTPFFDSKVMNDIALSISNNDELLHRVYARQEKNEYFSWLYENSDYRQLPEERKQMILAAESWRLVVGMSGNSGISIHSYTGKTFTDKDFEIVIRFAKVFHQTYTRLMDLKKAEAQTREAQIEVAVERVRAKALAMHKSDEIMTVVLTMRNELESLNIPGVLSTSITLRQEDGSIRLWDNTSTKQLEDGLWESTDMVFRLEENNPDFYFNRIWKTNEKYFVIEQDENDLPITVDWVRSFDSGMADTIVHFFKENDVKHVWHPGVQLSHGKLNLDSLTAPEPEMKTILLKMGAAFDLAYKRFLDLQKAEYQTQQAKIETALEKVRARALAMHQPEELIEVAEVLRHEMGLLGVEELETCSIYIYDEEIERIECWYALKDISSSNKKLVSDHFSLNLQETWVGKEMEKFYKSDDKQVSIVMQGANRKEWIKYCEEKSIPLRGYYGEVIPDRTYHLYKFSHGAIGAAAVGNISAESWDLLQRASSVFSLAYSRFKDLTHARIDLQRLKEEKQRAETALEELQNTQKQLIQSEKMASLGELTAGIAHEIQNPLNFVNNFSEINNELLLEMNEEIEKGNLNEVRSLAKDIIENEQKINHHGKRADAIVKGMLQHSRSNNGQKESTDINELVDEYLRLAYHGLRAKDKNFNATLRTDYDGSIGNVNIFPQDIGRLVLNLITNAFYAVTEKKILRQAQDDTYEPTVSLSTKKLVDKIEIKVSDNGNGIPPKILDKIFQPFFTTKPPGQGTGLGLSLSYDIVKAHGGELVVQTNVQEGTAFTISIPN